jgi:2-(1,2-epoxy-1,2-dihydrophenyl)acetyl-CoA isomerase
MLAPGFVGIGLVPDAGGAHFLARILGVPRAFEWMSSGRRLTAAEAQAWGLVSEVYEAEAFGEATAAYAAEWAAKPTRGVAMTKRLFDEAAGKGLEETLALEAELQGEATRTEDFAEGVAAFLEKRPPEFRGR